jgi:hypothetical protein
MRVDKFLEIAEIVKKMDDFLKTSMNKLEYAKITTVRELTNAFWGYIITTDIGRSEGP